MKGILASYGDLQRVYEDNRELHKFSKADLNRDLSVLHFLGIDSLKTNEYVVGRDSPFYPYLKKEGKHEVEIIF